MKRIFWFFCTTLYFLLLPKFASSQVAEVKKVVPQQIIALKSVDTDTLYVINFWATWCKPCVAELPHFIEVAKNAHNLKIRFIFASLDFENELESRLKPFLAKRNINQTVWLITDTDYNRWVSAVDKSWTGAIPATMFVNPKKKQYLFHEGELTKLELNNLLNKLGY